MIELNTVSDTNSMSLSEAADKFISRFTSLVEGCAGLDLQSAFSTPGVEEHWRNASDIFYCDWLMEMSRKELLPHEWSMDGFTLSAEATENIRKEQEILVGILPTFEKDLAKFTSTLLSCVTLGWKLGASITKAPVGEIKSATKKMSDFFGTSSSLGS